MFYTELQKSVYHCIFLFFLPSLLRPILKTRGASLEIKDTMTGNRRRSPLLVFVSQASLGNAWRRSCTFTGRSSDANCYYPVGRPTAGTHWVLTKTVTRNSSSCHQIYKKKYFVSRKIFSCCAGLGMHNFPCSVELNSLLFV